MHEAQPRGDARRFRAPLPCPRCETVLTLTQDLQHTTRFSYYRCRYGHGRLTPFFQFLREKNFIRPLDAAGARAPRREREDGALRELRRAGRHLDRCGVPVLPVAGDAARPRRGGAHAGRDRPPPSSGAPTPEPDRRGADRHRQRSSAARAGNGAQPHRGDRRAIDLVGLGFTALARLLAWPWAVRNPRPRGC